jgi:hypothetical protein
MLPILFDIFFTRINIEVFIKQFNDVMRVTANDSSEVIVQIVIKGNNFEEDLLNVNARVL